MSPIPPTCNWDLLDELKAANCQNEVFFSGSWKRSFGFARGSGGECTSASGSYTHPASFAYRRSCNWKSLYFSIILQPVRSKSFRIFHLFRGRQQWCLKDMCTTHFVVNFEFCGRVTAAELRSCASLQSLWSTLPSPICDLCGTRQMKVALDQSARIQGRLSTTAENNFSLLEFDLAAIGQLKAKALTRCDVSRWVENYWVMGWGVEEMPRCSWMHLEFDFDYISICGIYIWCIQSCSPHYMYMYICRSLFAHASLSFCLIQAFIVALYMKMRIEMDIEPMHCRHSSCNSWVDRWQASQANSREKVRQSFKSGCWEGKVVQVVLSPEMHCISSTSGVWTWWCNLDRWISRRHRISIKTPTGQKRKVDKGSFVLHWHHGQLLLHDDHPLSGQKIDFLELLLTLWFMWSHRL